jgi:hypothetical protein
LPAHFFLPKTKLAFTEIPKTGCTTLKNYLVELEDRFGQEVPGPTTTQYLGMKIHGYRGAGLYRVSKASFWRKRSSHRILVLRDPFRRVVSAWANKLLYAQSDFSIYRKYQDEPFTPKDFASLKEINQALELFLERLATDPEFLESDRHWRPQHTFVQNLETYDVVLETSNLGSLQERLSDDLKLGSLVFKRPVPRFNSTRPEMLEKLGTDRVWQLVEKVYAQDFELLATAGLGEPSRPDVISMSPGQEQSFLEKEWGVVEQSRRESISGSLSAIRNSWSWRLTAPLRTIGALFMR